MKIIGEKLVLPRNFEFFRRLPARFEILVIAKGAVRPDAATFEIEIQGQRLTLRSKVDLKPGARYELEKQSVTEFRITRETDSESAIVTRRVADRASAEARDKSDNLQLLFDGPNLTATDLWKVQAFAEAGGEVEQRGQKYRFDFESEAGMKGLFVPVSSGGYSLLISGPAAIRENIEAFQLLLEDLQIRSVSRVDAATFDRISDGAIDFSG